MDPELKEKWITALRSGEFQQATGQLKNGNRYCCLGVLCVLKGIKFEGNDIADHKWDGKYITILPELSEDAINALWPRNDGQHGFPDHNFEQIADYVEQNIPALSQEK